MSVLLIWFAYPQDVHSQSSGRQIRVGDTVEKLVELRGDEKKRTQRDEYDVWWYRSVAPSQADIYYSEREIIVFISAYIEDRTTLQSYIDQIGEFPQASFYRYDHQLADSLTQRVHVWFDQGISVITSGESVDSRVLREDQFEPMSLGEYWRTWGEKYAENKKVVLGDSDGSVSDQDSVEEIGDTEEELMQEEASFTLRIRRGVVVFVGALLLFVFVGLLLRKKDKKIEIDQIRDTTYTDNTHED